MASAAAEADLFVCFGLFFLFCFLKSDFKGVLNELCKVAARKGELLESLVEVTV